MGEPVQCYWIEPTEQQARWLRRYRGREAGGRCEQNPLGIHNAMRRVEDGPIVKTAEGYHSGPEPAEYRGDQRWPDGCICSYVFVLNDTWQVFTDTIYRRADTGEEKPLREWGPGAMWDAWWVPYKGPDGRSIVVRLPNGHDWWIDSRASNCTLPDDDEHQCWIRHGDPPDLTVDKDGQTCAAGGGSIASGSGDTYYHGFLREGRLVPA